MLSCLKIRCGLRQVHRLLHASALEAVATSGPRTSLLLVEVFQDALGLISVPGTAVSPAVHAKIASKMGQMLPPVPPTALWFASKAEELEKCLGPRVA